MMKKSNHMISRFTICRLLIFSLISGLVTHPALAAGERLSLEGFLSQVRQGHLGVKGALEASAGARQRSVESGLLFAPALSLSVQLAKDDKPTMNPTFQGTGSVANAYSLGISQQTRFGLQGKISYNLNYYSIAGANPAFLSQPIFHEARPTLELSYALLRNRGGAEVRATEELLQAQALAMSFSEAFRAKMAIAEAEMSYWRLVFARRMVDVQKASLERAKKIRDWNLRRAQMQLADRADLLQSEAALQGRELELQGATDEVAAASRAFNSARGMPADQVLEELEGVDSERVSRLEAPPRVDQREDVKAAQQQERLSAASATAAIEKGHPNLELFAGVSLNGRDLGAGSAVSTSFTSQYPTVAAGVRLSTSLAAGTASEVREGYSHEKAGAASTYERRLFESEREWGGLEQRLSEARRRLELARSLEKAQSTKLTYERDRQSRGRSTTFQVLLFEQDYAGAQLAHLQAQAEVLRLIAQMKTFGGSL